MRTNPGSYPALHGGQALLRPKHLTRLTEPGPYSTLVHTAQYHTAQAPRGTVRNRTAPDIDMNRGVLVYFQKYLGAGKKQGPAQAKGAVKVSCRSLRFLFYSLQLLQSDRGDRGTTSRSGRGTGHSSASRRRHCYSNQDPQ